MHTVFFTEPTKVFKTKSGRTLFVTPLKPIMPNTGDIITLFYRGAIKRPEHFMVLRVIEVENATAHILMEHYIFGHQNN